MHINQNHDPVVQFTTLAHELGHLFSGHLGPDKKLNVPERPRLGLVQEEFEAESVAYLVCERNGVHAKSQTYLAAKYVEPKTTVEQIDIYQVMRAAFFFFFNDTATTEIYTLSLHDALPI